MATQNGLFTQGPSVDDLLQQRNKRAFDLQRTLMQNAAQGARDPAKASAISLLGSAIGRGLGSRAGGEDEEMEALRAKEAERQAMVEGYTTARTSGTPQQQLQQGSLLMKAGYNQYGSELIVQGQEGIKAQKEKEAAAAARKKVALAEQQRREAATAQAASLGLDSTVELLNNGGDIDEAAKVIRDQEAIKVAQKGGRKGRVVLAQNFGSSATLINGVSTGKYDHMSDITFIKMLEGKEAKITHFKTPTGGIKPFRVDKGGKIFDNNSSTWVTPSELGLTAAPQLTQEIPLLDSITQSLIDVEVGNFTDLSGKANDAVGALDVNNVSQQIFDEGVISGAFGNVKLQAYKALIAAGMATEEAEKIVANTETYLAHRGLAVANVIKAFGSGTGLSDADREYARQIVGGEITMDEGAMSNLLRIEREGYHTLIKNHNKVLDRLGKLGSVDGKVWKKVQQFYITPNTYEAKQPTVPVTPVLSADTQAILDRVGQ